MNDLLSAALRYARRGWNVFPLRGKRPMIDGGHTKATTDPAQLRAWWKKWPDANIGLQCNADRGPIVLDVDGPTGASLIATLGLQPTRMATSGTKGKRHYYFTPQAKHGEIPRIIKLRVDGIKHELDILGTGGYVVAPPSVHPETGRSYRWLNTLTPSPLPDAVKRWVKGHMYGKTHEQAAPLPEILQEGERDALLTSLAGTMRRRGASPEAILAALREENETRLSPPLPDKQLKKIAKSIGKKVPVPSMENLTDLGNARRFIHQYGIDVRGVTSMRRPWLIWEGPRWTTDNTGEIERMAKETVRGLYREAEVVGDTEVRDRLLKHAARSEQAPRVRALLELAATEPEINLTADRLDASPWLFNVETGTLDLRTGQHRAHDRADNLTKMTEVVYDPSAKAPRWTAFLKEIMNGDQELVEFLQRAVGYSLTGDTREQCLFFCYGQGANGKSTFLEVLRELFGDYAQQADFTTFLARKGDGPRNDLARMRGARLITAVEAPGDRGFDEMVLKQLTGGDTVVARRLYEEFFEFKPQHKLWLAANHKPLVKEQTEAFWRRIRLIPFAVTFTKAQRDHKLKNKLVKELPGILNWALTGAAAWKKEGLLEPKAVRRATQSYREENDLLGEFIKQRCRPNIHAWTPTPELYRAFMEWWTETRGVRNTPSMLWFGRLLSERSDLRARKQAQVRGWAGLELLQETTT
jgi:putative DNA primase/helicase